MRDLYSDDYESVAGGGTDHLIPASIRRIAGAALFLGLIAAMGLWAYRLGTRDAAEVPIIRAMEGPARIQPEDPGGVQAAHQGMEVNSVLAGEPAPGPQPSAPLTPTPAALADEDGPQGELVVTISPAVLAEMAMQDGADLRMPVQEDGPEVVTLDAAPEFSPVDGMPDSAGGIAGDLAPDLDATEPNPDAGAIPGPRPRGRPTDLAVARAEPAAAATTTPLASRSAQPASAPAAREVSGLGAGTRLVQLGAYDSEAITRQAWDQLMARNGDLLAGKSLFVERTTANARVFYRLRVSGFQNTDQTREMCEALRARSVDCIPVTLQ